LKRVTKVTLKGLSLLFFLGYLTFYFIYQYTPVINNSVEDLINYFIKKEARVSFKNLSGMLLTDAVMEDVVVELVNGEIIYAKKLDAEFNLLSIIAGKYKFSSVSLDSLLVDVENAKPSTKEEAFFSLYHEIGKSDIIIDRLDISNGEYRINKEKNEIFKNINFKGSFVYTDDAIDINIKLLNAEFLKESKHLHNLSTRIEGDRDGIIFNQLNLKFEESTILGKGILKFNVKNNYQVFLDDVKLFSKDLKFLDKFFDYDGKYKFQAEIEGDRYQFSSAVNLDSARVEHLEFKRSFAKANYTFQREQLEIISSNINVNDATIDVIGNILNKNQYHAKFKNLNLADLKLLDIKTSLNGEAIFNQSSIDFSGESVALNQVDLKNSSIDRFFLRTAKIEFENKDGDFLFTNSSFIKLPKSLNSSLSGELSVKKRTLYLNILSNKTDYSNFLENYSLPIIDGKLDGSHTLSGSFDNVNLESLLFSDSLFFSKYKIADAKLNIKMTNIFDNIRGNMELKSGQAIFEGLEFDSLLTFLDFGKDSVHIQKLSLLRGENGFQAEGSIYKIDSVNYYDFNKIKLSYNDYTISNSNNIKIKQIDSTYNIDNFAFVAPGGGSIRSKGFYNSAEGKLNIEVNNIDINPFNSLIEYEHSFMGVVNGTIDILDLVNLKLTMNLDINALSVYPKLDSTIFQRIGRDTLAFGHVITSLNYQNDELELNELSIIDKDEQLYIKGNAKFFLSDTSSNNLIENAELDIKSEFKDIDLKQYNVFIGYYKELNGKFNGKINIGGTVKNPRGQIDIQTEDLKINKLNFSGFINSRFDEKHWLFDSIRIKVNESEVFGSGKKELNFEYNNFWELFASSPFEFNLKSVGDTITALSAISNEITAIIGQYDIDIKLAGTFDHPYIESGYLKFTDAYFLVDRIANPLLNINYYGKIYNKRLILDGFKANTYYKRGGFLGLFKEEDEGTMNVNGYVDFSHLFHPKLNLNIDLEHFYADYYRKNIRAVVNSNNINAIGADTLDLTGNLKILDGDLHYDFGSELQRKHSESVNLSSKRTIMSFEIDIDDNFRVKNEDPNGIRGMDFSIYTPIGEPFIMSRNVDGVEEYRGKILIENGSFTSYKTFEIENGEINFNQKDARNTAFNPKVTGRAFYEDDRYKYKLIVDNFLDRMLSEMRFEVYGQDNELIALSREKTINLLAFGKEDFSDFDLGSAATNTALLLANTRFLSSIGIENISLKSDEENIDNNKQESDLNRRVKLRTKQFSIYGNLKTQFEINSGGSESKYLEQINLYYKLSDFFRIHFDASQKSNTIYSNPEDNSSVDLNLRLKWYYEF
jgi:hypothetical protein